MKTLLLAATILAVSAPAAFAQCCTPGENLVLASNEAAADATAQDAAAAADEATPDATAADAAATEPATGDQGITPPDAGTSASGELTEDGLND